MNASRAIVAFADEGAASLAARKVALLLATGVSCHYSLTPPHKAAPKTVLEKETIFERAIQWVTFCSKTMVWMMTLTDSLATILAAAKASSSSPQMHDPLLRVSPVLAIGACAVICANLLRQWCFRELGHLFTFEITIRSDHSLVTTGPYGLVRHPSYLGIYLTLLGPTLVGSAKGSWLREYLFRAPSGWWGLPGPGQALVFALVAFWFVKLCVVFKGTFKRLGIEDRALQKEFGGKWDEYARRVRWSIIPGVY